MNISEARQVAYDWHGGGESPLYQFASTGQINIYTADRLQDDIEACIDYVKDSYYVRDSALPQLESLLVFVINQKYNQWFEWELSSRGDN